ncbi:MAG: ATP-dependent helicase [Candidatus Omnitrophota bacterium]
MKKIDFESQLNPEQYRVVTEGEGPCLALAGPGSGKTRTLVYRVAYLLSEGILPSEILLLTFTNKAAREMLRRVELLCGRYPAGLVGGTFHHVGNVTLRRYADDLGYTKSFSILDRSDSKDLLSQTVEGLKLEKDRLFPKADIISDIISFAVNSCRNIGSVIQSQYFYLERFSPEIERVANTYRQKKKTANVMDYDDLLNNWLLLLKENSSALNFYQDKFRYILVDEYQDTNRLQFEIIKLLAEKHQNIMAVGDDAQSIYSFRAADLKNVLEFPKVFPGNKIFRLETNYRSIPEIIRLANDSIKNNQNQFPKTLRSIRKPGPKPLLISTRSGFSEARFVTRRILDLRSEGMSLSEIAVLFRARYQATELEMELTRQGIPYLIRGGVRFYEQAHIKDILSYLKILVNDRDELAWRRIFLQVEGIGNGYFGRIWKVLSGETALSGGKAALSGESDRPLTSFLKSGTLTGLPQRSQPGLNNLQKLLRKLIQPEMANHPASQIKTVLNSEYRDYCLSTYPDGPERLLEIEELTKIAVNFNSTEQFLSETIMGEEYRGETVGPFSTVISEAEKETDVLALSTIHQAKGLEWKAVFIISLADGRFPHAKSADNPERLEEERRLFYVAVTRAKSLLYLVQPIIELPGKVEYGWKSRLDRLRRGKPASHPEDGVPATDPVSRFVQELSSKSYQETLTPDPKQT